MKSILKKILAVPILILGFIFWTLFSFAQYAFADTTTVGSSLDTTLRSSTPTTNYSTLDYMTCRTSGFTCALSFTMPASLGTITDISLTLCPKPANNTFSQAEVHKMTRNNLVESEATWNVYSSGNNWTSPGGDYSGSVLDTLVFPDTNTCDTANVTGSYTWGDEATFLVIGRSGQSDDNDIATKEISDSAKRPLLTITYTAGGGGDSGTSTQISILGTGIFAGYATSTVVDASTTVSSYDFFLTDNGWQLVNEGFRIFVYVGSLIVFVLVLLWMNKIF